MNDSVNEWKQQGRLYIWRYADPKPGWRGWHFAADPPGCRSMRNLLDCLDGGEPSHRTLRLERLTDAILSVPNYNRKAESFAKLRLVYRPDAGCLALSPEEEVLVMTAGDKGLRKLSTAFAQVELGGGDFGITTSDHPHGESCMFWWMPGINYRHRRQP